MKNTAFVIFLMTFCQMKGLTQALFVPGGFTSSGIGTSSVSNNVGIGTSSPAAALDIKWGSYPYPHLYLTTSRTFSSSRSWGIGTNWNNEGDFSILQSANNSSSPN